MLLDGQLFKVKPNLSLTHAYRYAVNVIYFLDGKNKFPALVSLKDTVANRFATEKLETEKDDLETKA